MSKLAHSNEDTMEAIELHNLILELGIKEAAGLYGESVKSHIAAAVKSLNVRHEEELQTQNHAQTRTLNKIKFDWWFYGAICGVFIYMMGMIITGNISP